MTFRFTLSVFAATALFQDLYRVIRFFLLVIDYRQQCSSIVMPWIDRQDALQNWHRLIYLVLAIMYGGAQCLGIEIVRFSRQRSIHML